MPFEPRLVSEDVVGDDAWHQDFTEHEDAEHSERSKPDDAYVDLELPEDFQELAAQLTADADHLGRCYPGIPSEDRDDELPGKSRPWMTWPWMTWSSTAAAVLVLVASSWSLGLWNAEVRHRPQPQASAPADASAAAKETPKVERLPTAVPAMLQQQPPPVTPASMIREPLSGEDLEGLSDLGDVSMSI